MSDPKRLLDEARDGDLANLLSAGKGEMPDNAQLGALAAKIGILGGLGGAGAAGASGAAGGGAGAGAGTSAGAKLAAGATAAKTGLALKIGGAVVVASAASATAIVATSTRDEPPKTPVGIVATPATSNSAANGEVPPAGLRITAAPSESAPPPPASSSVRTSTSAAPEGPEAEVRLLERAQDALRSRPAEALALADDHARRFPRGMLAQEREVIAIEALVKTGRTSEAKARAARFKARFPGSSHTRRIETLVGE